MKPQHAQLLAADLDEETLDPLPRPLPDVLHPHRRPAAAHRHLAQQARGRHRLPARGVIDDSLGIGAELEADMAAHRRHLPVRVEGDARGSRASCKRSAPSSTSTRPIPASSSSASASSTARPPGTRSRARDGRPADRVRVRSCDSASHRHEALDRRLRARRHRARHRRLRARRRRADRGRARRRERASTRSTTSIRSARRSCSRAASSATRAASRRSPRRSTSRASICDGPVPRRSRRCAIATSPR